MTILQALAILREHNRWRRYSLSKNGMALDLCQMQKEKEKVK